MLKINRNREIKADPNDALARVIAPIVQGQVRSFLNDHGRQLGAKLDHDTIVHSLSKRIINDLLCAGTRARLRQAVLVANLEQPKRAPVVARSRSLRAWLVSLWPRPMLLPSSEQTGET